MTTSCWFCGAEMVWSSDYDTEDMGGEPGGIVACLSCSSCGASAEFTSPLDEKLDLAGGPLTCHEQMRLPGCD